MQKLYRDTIQTFYDFFKFCIDNFQNLKLKKKGKTNLKDILIIRESPFPTFSTL